MTDAERALHVLIARCHLALAGVRDLTADETDLIDELHRWMKRRRRRR